MYDICMAVLTGLEPATTSVTRKHATLLHYRTILEQMRGIEPPFSAWEADVLTIVRHLHGDRRGIRTPKPFLTNGFQDRPTTVITACHLL